MITTTISQYHFSFINTNLYGLMHRILGTLPPGRKPWVRAEIDATYNSKVDEILKNTKYKPASARVFAHQAIIGNNAYGMPLRDIMALFGFQTEYTLRCDHCKDEDSCRFYMPETAYCYATFPLCADCHGSNSSRTCTFNGIANSPELKEAIRKFKPFRRHVPCNQCFEGRQECDNRAGVCERCEVNGKECVREACKIGSEQGDDSECPKDCDKAHKDDEYTNVSDKCRGRGHNVRLLLRKDASKARKS